MDDPLRRQGPAGPDQRDHTHSLQLHNEDEDSGYPPPRPGDEHFSIKGSNDSDKDLQFTFDVNSHACQGDIRGQHDSESTAVVSKGSASYAASVKLYITANELAAP